MIGGDSGGSFPIGWGSSRVRTQAGTVVDEDLALTYSACWCATRLLAETVASLPLVVYRRKKNDDREQAPDHPLYDLLKTAPNGDMGSMAFREGRTQHQVNWGNGFAEIERETADPRSPIVALNPIHPRRVRPTRPADTDYRGMPLWPKYPYMVRNNDGTSTALRADEMLHIPGVLSEDGVWGKGVIAYARQSIGFGLGTERHGASVFGNGSVPRGIVKVPGLKDSDARKAFRAEWKQIHGSPDSGEIAILPVDGEFQQITISNEDNQFLQTRVHNVKEIARWYRIPVHMLSELAGPAGYNSIEMFSLEFVIYSLLPWIRRWEEQLELKLLTAEERKEYFVEHLLAGLLRGDLTTRFNAYAVALNNGFMTRNEVRRLENLNSVGPAGDKLFVPLNMVPLEEAGMGTPATGAAVLGPDGKPVTEAAPEPETESRELLDVEDIRQPNQYACGAAAAMCCGKFFNVGPDTIEEWEAALGTTLERSTHPMRIVEYLTELGLAVTASHNLTVDDLREFWERGMPVICPVQDYGDRRQEGASFAYGHYLTVIGATMGFVFAQDSSVDNVSEGSGSIQAPGRVMIEESDWMAAWHDEDVDGKPYIQFGIAVAARVEDIVAGDEEDDADEDTTDEQTATNQDAGETGDSDEPRPSIGAHAGNNGRPALQAAIAKVGQKQT